MTAKRLRFVLAGVFTLLICLSARLFYIQIFQGLAYAAIAQRQFVKQVKTEPYRGDILDRNGALLATSIESQSLFLRPREARRPGELLRFLSTSLAMNPAQIRAKLNSGGEFVWLERKLNPLQAKLVADKKIPGLGVQNEQRRYYPNGALACHLIGAVGMDNHGLSGLEQAMDSYLTGKPYVVNQIRDGKGRNLLVNAPKDAQSGGPGQANSVELTIDRTLQFMAESEIRKGVEDNRAKRGMILIENPKTGEILAMASYPNFDPNHLSRGGRGPRMSDLQLQNPMVNRVFEPGSTFKLVTFAAALEEKKCALSDTFDCEGGKWHFANVTIKDHEPSQVLSLPEVLEKSSNIGSAKIGLKLGKDSLYEYARAFGFGTRTGIPIPGETEGLLTAPKDWSLVSLPNISFGQGVGVTALQLIGAYSAVANGGVLMEPMLVKQLNETKNGKILKKTLPPQSVRRVISAETARTLKELLRNVVERGTGGEARVSGYSVAGKTGTAQKIDPATHRYSPRDYMASFCGFAPVEDPQLVCLVVLDSPQKDIYGGSTAAPVFARALSRAADILGIPPQSAPKTVALLRSR